VALKLILITFVAHLKHFTKVIHCEQIKKFILIIS